jgi:putative membrane protein
MGGGGGTGGASAAALLSDAQILAVLDTLNLGEVTEAQAAEPRLMDDDVAAFADEMIQEHGAARQQVTATATSLGLQPAMNPTQMQLKTESDARVMAIMNATTAMVDAVYVSGQVMAHGSALALLTELQAAADAEPLKTLIGMQRMDVQEHLTEAMMLP